MPLLNIFFQPLDSVSLEFAQNDAKLSSQTSRLQRLEIFSLSNFPFLSRFLCSTSFRTTLKQTLFNSKSAKILSPTPALT